MFVTFAVVKLLTFNACKLVHPLNILDISVTFVVLKLASNVTCVKPEQPKNILV